MTAQTFDGLADTYDRNRPRYPQQLWEALAARLPRRDNTFSVVDAGSGTGIALEGLLPHLPKGAQVTAVDMSPDMVRVGAQKFPEADWVTGSAETLVEGRVDLDLLVSAQAYQWMDRPRLLAAAYSALRPGGVIAILQNNREFSASVFLEEYEGLLETYSPGYSRDYRSFDITKELAEVFGREQTAFESALWVRPMLIADFLDMARSSIQVRAAVAAEPQFLDKVRELAHKHSDSGSVDIPYKSELYTAVR